jgi:hypothetical protein
MIKPFTKKALNLNNKIIFKKIAEINLHREEKN